MHPAVTLIGELHLEALWKQYWTKLRHAAPFQQVSCWQGSTNLLMQHVGQMMDHYQRQDQPQVLAPPDASAGHQWVTRLDDNSLYIALLPSPGDPSEQPTAVVLTPAMLSKCCRSISPSSGSMRVGYGPGDD